MSAAGLNDWQTAQFTKRCLYSSELLSSQSCVWLCGGEVSTRDHHLTVFASIVLVEKRIQYVKVELPELEGIEYVAYSTTEAPLPVG